MRKTCAVCPTEFEAKRAAAKYCSERCKKRAQRKPGGVTASKPPEPKVADLPAEPTINPAAVSVATATAVELERAGRLETAIGQAAFALARRIDASSAETGASLASLVREHRATLAEALRDAETATDPLDELRMRRERKLAGG